jgi:hypothetical protein
VTTYALHRKKGESFFDDNDPPRVLSAGILYFYEEGGTTPLTVYKRGDDSGATPWGTSVTLDSAGKTTDAIYVDETNFKEVLKDSDGATIFEKDHYQGSPAAPADPNATRPLTAVEPASSATVTVDAADVGKFFDCDDSGGNITVVLPDPGDVDNGEWLPVRKIGATNAVTIDNTYTEETIVLNRQYDVALFVSNGVDTWVLLGIVRPQLLLNAQADKLLAIAADPNADRLLFWDDSAGAWAYLALSGLTITDTTLAVDAASATAAGVQENADQSEMEAASSILRTVTPGMLKYDPAHPKVVAKFGVTGNLSLDVGVSSITDNGTGDATVNFDTNFNSTTTMGALVGTERGAPVGVNVCERVSAYAVGSVRVNAEDSDNETAIDPTTWTVAVWGDYA